jgi:hypothetical protein
MASKFISGVTLLVLTKGVNTGHNRPLNLNFCASKAGTVALNMCFFEDMCLCMSEMPHL